MLARYSALSIHRYNSSNADEVVATVARGPYGLTRHDLPGGVAITYLYDGNEDRRGTCQWRILALDGEALRQAVVQLTAALDRVGVTYDAPRFREELSWFQDNGPWPTPAAE
ncbi:MAG: hypothetical protein QM811_13025 [Pirellulales bacterium]